MRYFVTSVFAISLLGSSAAMAQQVDCANPLTQSDMNICAADMYRAADGDLNLAYRMATAKAREMDQYVAAGEVTNLDMLRDAQRAWIPFRDKACSAESNLARGGSMQPLLFHSCLERLTRQRTQDLRFFGEVN
jgi:uncharacterized protein YecT (DUF1311 family)